MPSHVTEPEEPTSLLLFPDTNLLMECIELRQLPWADLFPDNQIIRLVLVRTVVREIDRLKTDGKTRRNRRARLLSSGLLTRLLDSDIAPIVVRDNGLRVDAVLSVTQPSVAYPGLDMAHPDERIIAETLAYVAQHPAASAVFLSNDTIALHTAKAHGLSCLRIPDSWLAPPDPDPSQKQVQQLEERVRALGVCATG